MNPILSMLVRVTSVLAPLCPQVNALQSALHVRMVFVREVSLGEKFDES